ncbi:nuclear transport factor 2 family protein [Flavihumibacter petaseus]|uniref:DUF4440 domain-containing protein n=1 Tax=Flavihumibacter petaseus NBRC 106054 TaxID=1220578 RepID=A0A0E9MUZ2_9BACT|nr:nuclear transport factor 2 family protein [Flavihumibacter petaseus]GAO41567.1 hypothetical protein FPE01S_01_05810 [Flavihumibacter petaseus NBRC 106054]
MKKFPLVLAMLIVFSVASAQQSAASELVKEVEAAETLMFSQMNYEHAAEYFKNHVSKDFITINADGVMANKQEAAADTARLKMTGSAQLKIVERKIRVYGTVGISTGRAQAYVNGTMVVEFLYTAIFVKENGDWKYTGWQGTLSKDSPHIAPPPSGK